MGYNVIMAPFIGNTSQAAVAGDWHGDTGWALHCLDAADKAGITTIFHLGDFGIWPGQDGAKFIQKVQNRASRNGQRLFVTPGNHEDYSRIDATEVDKDGWQWYRDNVILIPRGHRWEFGGRSFVSLGGANSIDFEGRTENIDWWAGERITYGDEIRTREGGHADIMLAHEAPTGCQPLDTHRSPGYWGEEELAYAEQSSASMRSVVDVVKPKLFFHGHYHNYSDKMFELYGDEGAYMTRVVCLNMNKRTDPYTGELVSSGEKNMVILDPATMSFLPLV